MYLYVKLENVDAYLDKVHVDSLANFFESLEEIERTLNTRYQSFSENDLLGIVISFEEITSLLRWANDFKNEFNVICNKFKWSIKIHFVVVKQLIPAIQVVAKGLELANKNDIIIDADIPIDDISSLSRYTKAFIAKTKSFEIQGYVFSLNDLVASIPDKLDLDFNKGWTPKENIGIPGLNSCRLISRMDDLTEDVWLAKDEKTERLWLVKFCFSANKVAHLSHLLQIDQQLGRSGSNYAKVTASNLNAFPYYVSFEYSQEGSLLDWFTTNKSSKLLGANERVAIMRKAADALHALHESNQLYQDLRPEHVLVFCDQHGNISIKLLNPGLLINPKMEQWESSNLISIRKYLYMAPELIENGKHTAQTDIYALGVLFYQLIIVNFNKPLIQNWHKHVTNQALKELIASMVNDSITTRFTKTSFVIDKINTLDERDGELQEVRRKLEHKKRWNVLKKRVWGFLGFLTGCISIWVFVSYGFALKDLDRVTASEEQESTSAEYINNFLIDIFELVDPMEGLGVDAKAIDLLDLAVNNLETGFSDDLTRKVKLLTVTGQIYRSLGNFDRSEQLLNQAHELIKNNSFNDSFQYAELLDQLAILAREKREPVKANGYAKQAVDIKIKTYGSDHPKTAISQSILASTYRILDDFENAENLTQQVLSIVSSSNISIEPETKARLINNAASIYEKIGEIEKALELYQQAYTLRVDFLPAMHLDLADTLNSIAIVYQKLEQYEESINVLQQAFDIRKQKLGYFHPAVARTASNLSAIFYISGDYLASLEIGKEALVIKQKTLELDHPSIALSYNNLANIYFRIGDLKQAKTMHQKALSIRQAKLPNNHTHIAQSQGNLANTLFYLGFDEGAELKYVDALSIRKNANAMQTMQAAGDLFRVAQLYYWNKKYDLAQQYFSQALSIYKETQSEAYQKQALSHLWLAQCAFAQDQIDNWQQSLQAAEKIVENHLLDSNILHDNLLMINLMLFKHISNYQAATGQAISNASQQLNQLIADTQSIEAKLLKFELLLVTDKNQDELLHLKKELEALGWITQLRRIERKILSLPS